MGILLPMNLGSLADQRFEAHKHCLLVASKRPPFYPSDSYDRKGLGQRRCNPRRGYSLLRQCRRLGAACKHMASQLKAADRLFGKFDAFKTERDQLPTDKKSRKQLRVLERKHGYSNGILVEIYNRFVNSSETTHSRASGEWWTRAALARSDGCETLPRARAFIRRGGWPAGGPAAGAERPGFATDGHISRACALTIHRSIPMACLELQRHDRVRRFFYHHPHHCSCAGAGVCRRRVCARRGQRPGRDESPGRSPTRRAAFSPASPWKRRTRRGARQVTVTDGTGQFTFSGLVPGRTT